MPSRSEHEIIAEDKLAFGTGCGWGALTVIAAKEKTETRGPVGAN
jgi:hypothetical protein